MKSEVMKEVEVLKDSSHLDYKIHSVKDGKGKIEIMENNGVFYNKYVRTPFGTLEEAVNALKAM